MNNTSSFLGFGSAVLGSILLLAFTFCFIALIANNPQMPAAWTTLPDYLAYTQQTDQALKYIAQCCMLLFCPLFVIMAFSLHEITPPAKQYWARLGSAFAIGFCVLTTTMYFVQLTTVRLGAKGIYTSGIEQFIQFYPYAGILSIGMLGMTLFLGLASLCMAPLFRGNRLQVCIRIFLLINGFSCLSGGLAYAFDNVWVINLTMNLGMGGSLLILTSLLAVYFSRQLRHL
ncbi:MAG: hypothetical protein AAF564_07255 [Bacteroidota bacterium]